MSTNPVSGDPLGDRLMNWFWRKPAESLAERSRRRVCVHLIPVLFFLYILAYLDRVNISAASLDMRLSPSENGLGLTDKQIGLASGMFFWTYWILEIPSTLSVVRWGARWVFCRILVLWGICATLTGFIGLSFAARMFGWLPSLPADWPGWAGIAAAYVNELPGNPLYQLHVFRLLLGFFEGGFFPSVIVYLTYWFRAQDRAKAIASFMVAIPLSSALGLPFSKLLLPIQWFGIAGWRWIFIIEGFAPILAGIAVLWFLPNRPRDAAWLPADERDALVDELEREQASKKQQGHGAWKHHLGMVALLTCVYFCLNVASYGLSMFMPSIIKSQLRGWGVDATSSTATLVASLPFFSAFVMMMFNGWHSDRTGERIWHVAVPLAISSLGITLAALFDGTPGVPLVMMILVVGSCLYAHLPAFWSIPPMFLGSVAAASAIGFINMIGNLGGSVGPYMVGNAAEVQKSASDKTTTADSSGTDKTAVGQPPAISAAPSDGAKAPEQKMNYRTALLTLAPWPITASGIILIVGYARRRRTDAGIPPPPAGEVD